MMSAFTAIVSGRVQLVRFRSFTLRHARHLGLVGEVENMPDGTVKVIAEGEKDKLDLLIKQLHTGPLLAKVAGVTVQWAEPQGTYNNFSIRNPWTV